MKMERRTIDFTEIRAENSVNEGEPRQIVGYAAVFNSPSEMMYGFMRESIEPGAFSQSLIENDIRALFDHDSAHVLGRNRSGTLSLTEDDRGLKVSITPPDTQWARDLMVSVERGDISQMSFGFIVRQEEWQHQADGTEHRILKNVDLREVSVVAFPAYTQTSVSVRHLHESDAELAEMLESKPETLTEEHIARLKRSFERYHTGSQQPTTRSIDTLRRWVQLKTI